MFQLNNLYFNTEPMSKSLTYIKAVTFFVVTAFSLVIRFPLKSHFASKVVTFAA